MKNDNLACALSIDAVAASVDLPLGHIVAALSIALQAETRTARPVPGRGYSSAVDLVDPATEKRYCKVMYGAAHEKPHVYAEGTETYDSPATYRALCEVASGAWRPSRIDPALDFEHGDWFDLLSDHLHEIALRKNLGIDYRGDWKRGKARTLYIGSRTSMFYIRLYEYRACHGYGPGVRLELEIKMKPRDRERLASLTPHEMLCASATVNELLERFAIAVPGERFQPGHKAPQSLERDLSFLANTAYPALLRVIAHNQGSIEDAVREVVRYREASEKVRLMLLENNCDTLSQSAYIVSREAR